MHTPLSGENAASDGLELFAIPFACSMGPHIALHELGLAHSVRWVGRTGELEGGGTLRDVNPKGKVSTLRMAGGEILTENAAVLLCLDGLGRARSAAGRDLVRLVEWLCFIGTELHKQVLAPAFDPAARPETRTDTQQRLLPAQLRHVEAALSSSDYLLGGAPSVADAYLLWAVVLLQQIPVELSSHPAIGAFYRRMVSRAAVKAALELERAAFARLSAGTKITGTHKGADKGALR